jgi:hypothetical protein
MRFITVAIAMLLRNFGPYEVIFIMRVFYDWCRGVAIEVFWDKWDNICGVCLYSR